MSAAQATPSQAQSPTSTADASTDVELGNLTNPAVDNANTSNNTHDHANNNTTASYAAEFAPAATITLDDPPEPHVGPQAASMSSEPAPISMPQPALVRQETFEAIGPSTDLPTPLLPTGDSASHTGPVIIINLLLTSTGTRHPYKIDERYLSKRGVTAEGDNGVFDPFVISVYTLKELIWRDWREEWEPRPTSPSAIRLIHFGRFLDDKLPLKECRFTESAPNVVHMSVKPQEVIDDEENTKSGSKGSIRRNHESGDREAGCRCIIL